MNKINKIIIVLIVLFSVFISVFYFLNKNKNNIQNLEIGLTDSVDSSIKIIAFGDSLTAGYGLNLNEAYPAQLESKLVEMGYDISIINSGVSGETSRGNKERAKFIASQNPDIIILGIGGNDALRFLPVSETRKNIEETIDILKENSKASLKILLLEMQAPLTAGLEYKKDFDILYKEIANKKGLILVPFLNPEIFLNSENKLPDGIHYNKEGYKKVVENYILPEVVKVLKNQ